MSILSLIRKWQVVAALSVGLLACQLSPSSLEPRLQVEEPAPPPPEPRGPVAVIPGAETPVSEPVSPVIERGTGDFLRRAPAYPTATIARDEHGEITLNMVDADVREVVRVVLGEALGANYVIDPTVQGTITVQTSQPVQAQDLLAVLDAVLRVSGAALVRVGELYKVVPIGQARSSGPTPTIYPLAEAGTPGFGIQVVPLRHISATEMERLLQPFAPAGGSIQVDPNRNLLLLTGSPHELETLTELVATFDVDWLAGMSFGLLPLKSVSANLLVAELEEVFGGLDAGPLTGVIRFVPLDRLSAVLVISSRPEYLNRARVWIERLDRTGDVEEEQIFVYPVQNGRAADLAGVLREIFDARIATVGPSDLLAPGLQHVQIRSSMFQGTEGEAERANEPDPGPRSEQGRIEGRGPFDGGERPLRGEVRIIADETTNSLVIRASRRAYTEIESALRQLDIIPLQVLIEVTIAEVSLDGQLRYGVEWFLRHGDTSFAFSRLLSGLATPNPPGFTALFSNADVRAVFNALEQETDVKVISSPQLLVLDNQTARLQVGDQVPIATRSVVSITDPDAPVVNAIEQRDTGVILAVTPRVNTSGLVTMEIDQETSDPVRTESSEINSPTIRQRRVASTVAVQSGQTVVLGGLIRDNREKGTTGIPVLQHLPIIGPVFGVTDNRSTRTELLVVITPRVIHNPDQARAVTKELRQRLRSLAPLELKVR